MEKRCETPPAEKSRFDYRGQVVVASYTSVPAPDSPRTIYSDGCNVENLVVLGYDICNSF